MSEVLAGEPYPGPFRAFHESLGGGAQVLAHVLLEDGLEIAVAQVLLDGGVNRILQCGLVLGQQNGDVGAGANLTLQQAQVGVRVLLEVLGEGHRVIGGQLGTAGEHLLDGFVEAGNLNDGGAAFLYEPAGYRGWGSRRAGSAGSWWFSSVRATPNAGVAAGCRRVSGIYPTRIFYAVLAPSHGG